MLLIVVSLFCCMVQAQISNLSVSAIPDSLLKNSKSVIRENTMEFELVDLHRCKLKEIKTITVLDEGGEDHLSTEFAYSSNVLIDQISITFYDKNGNKIRSLGRRDLMDMSLDPYGSIYMDDRKLHLSTTSSDYPYTFKYEISYTFNYSYSFPTWKPIESYNQSLQHGSFKVTLPVDYKINYKEIGPTGKINQIKDGTKVIYSWEINNIASVKYEAFAPQYLENIPKVMLSPSDFAYDNYRGNMSSWKEFGMFIYTLLNGRNDISPELKLKVRQMTAGIDDPVEKVKILYKYLQSTTRYVSIQIGIGGLQPFPASTVEKYGYGDCKALSNYMKTLLEAVDIKSYCSIIKASASRYYYDTSFVHDPYDHMILNVPLNDGEIWLECTSQISPFGFLGDFTDDRYALVITESGGILKKTTSYKDDRSIQSRNSQITLGLDRNANTKISTQYTGLYYDDILMLLNTDYERQKDYLYDQHIDIPDFKMNSFGYENFPEIFPSAIEKLDLDLINYTSISGTRMFVPLNLMNKFDYVPKNETERVNPIHINREISESDTLYYQLPEGYTIEYLPESDSIETCFGKLTVSISENGRTIKYVRNLTIYRKEHPRESYGEFIRFCRYINKMDNLKLVLIKK